MTNEEKEMERSKKFIEEYGELVKKHGLDFVYIPTWIQDSTGYYKMQLVPRVVDVSKSEGFIPAHEPDKKN